MFQSTRITIFPKDADLASDAVFALANALGGTYPAENGLYFDCDGLKATIIVAGRAVDCQVFSIPGTEDEFVAVPRTADYRFTTTFTSSAGRRFRINRHYEVLTGGRLELGEALPRPALQRIPSQLAYTSN